MQRRPTKKALASEQVDLFAIYGSFNPQTTHPVHATSQKEIFSFFWISNIACMSPIFYIPSEKWRAKLVVGLSFRIAVLPTACQLPVNFLCWTHRNLSRGRNCRQPDGGKIPTSCVVPANSGGERGKVICGRIYPGEIDGLPRGRITENFQRSTHTETTAGATHANTTSSQALSADASTSFSLLRALDVRPHTLLLRPLSSA